MARKRGAPKNNINALKHGFYARQFRAPEMADLDKMFEAGSQVNLIDEIALLRITMRRVLQLSDGIQDLDMAIRLLGVLGATSTRIAGLLRTHKILSGGGDPTLDAVALAIQQLSDDWNLKGEPK